MNNAVGNSRRDFLYQSALVFPACILSRKLINVSPAPRFKMGLQLFSIREPLTKDVAGTIRQVSQMGYQDSETYGYDPVGHTYYGIKPDGFSRLLEDHGMITTSGHYDFSGYFDKGEDEMTRYVDQCIEGAASLKQQYITWPWLDPRFRTMENFKLLAGKLNRIGERINAAGIGFAYHNHDFEFTDYGGTNGYDVILEETDPSLVKLQLDLFWVMHSSRQTPAELIARQPGRFVMWHIKDMDKLTRDYSELGKGSIDFSKILPLWEKAGLQHYYIEQGGNFEKDPMQSVKESAVYFKANLEKYMG